MAENENTSIELEVVGKASFVHVLDAYVSDYGKKAGWKPSYSLQLAIEKGSNQWDKFVAAAKEILGTDKVKLGDMWAKDGDHEVSGRTGNPVKPGYWLVTLSSQFPVNVVDVEGKPLDLDDEPGNDSLANCGITMKLGSISNDTGRQTINAYLSGVQFISINENSFKQHEFGAYTEQAIDDNGEETDVADAF